MCSDGGVVQTSTARMHREPLHATMRMAGLTGMWILGGVGVLACARIEAAPVRPVADHASLSGKSAIVDATPGTYDAVMAQRGQVQFAASCAQCHTKPGTGKSHRALMPFTKLRDLWRHPPYFTDGSATTLAAVVEHYDAALNLRLSQAQQRDLVEYLKSR